MTANDRSLAPRVLLPALVLLVVGCSGPDAGPGDAPTGELPETRAEMEADTAAPGPEEAPVVSRTVYVPDYAHIYHGSGSERDRYALTTTLSIRNTDPERSITVASVRYYNTQGELARRFLERPRRLGPLGTLDFVVAEHDTSGGSGANFLVQWSAAEPVSEPVIESVMISTRLGQGLSFTSRGVPVVRTEE